MGTIAKLLAAGALTTCACGAGLSPALAARPGARSAAATTTVKLKNISFTPATVRIARGGSVKWVWKDGDTPHDVTFAGRHSKIQQSGSYTLSFGRAGTFKYHCTIHPGMDGRVVVR